MHDRNGGRRLGSCILVGFFVSAHAVFPAAVQAAECPADQKKENVRAAPTDKIWDGGKLGSSKTIIDMITATIDVTKAPVNIKDRSFRLRRLEVEPGGIVPWHSHANRPAIAYLLEGTLTEYASNCAVPVVHTPGDVIVETPNLSHWWKNFGDKKAVVISADLLKGKDDNM
jgi:quercetin dioxygenase-like cupin family protein